MQTDDLISRLASEAKPVRRLASPARRWALWALASAAGSGAYLAAVGARMDLCEIAARPLFLLEFSMLLALALAAGAAALALSVPGMESRRGSLWITRSAAAAWLFLIGGRIAAGDCEAHGCMACASAVSLGSLWPILLLFWMARRAAPLYPWTIGALCGLGGAGWGALVLLIHCPNSDPLHTLQGHALPVAALSVAGAVIGAFVLRWRGRR